MPEAYQASWDESVLVVFLHAQVSTSGPADHQNLLLRVILGLLANAVLQ